MKILAKGSDVKTAFLLVAGHTLGFPSRKVSLHGVQEKPWHWQKKMSLKMLLRKHHGGSLKGNDPPNPIRPRHCVGSQDFKVSITAVAILPYYDAQ